MMNRLLLATVMAVVLAGARVEAGCGNCGGKQGHGHGRAEKAACKGGECKVHKGKGASARKAGDESKLPTLGTRALKVLLETKDDLILLDARSDKYDDGRRIPGAVQLTDKSTQEQLNKVLPDKDALIVAYCSNLKCPASTRLGHHLRKHGYTNVIKYPQGIESWMAAGFNVTTVNKDKK